MGSMCDVLINSGLAKNGFYVFSGVKVWPGQLLVLDFCYVSCSDKGLCVYILHMQIYIKPSWLKWL